MSATGQQLITVDQVNALIDLIGNTRQVPVVQTCYATWDWSKGDNPVPRNLKVRIWVDWYKRVKSKLVRQGESHYEWNGEKWVVSVWPW